MKKKTHMFRHLFLFCLLAMAVAFGNPTGHTTVSAAKKASYKIINKKETKKRNKLKAKYLYQLPQLKGKSAAVKKINQSLQEEYEGTLDSKEELFDFFENAEYSSSYKATFFDTHKCKVTYNQNGYICFKFTSEWYAGGVYNGWEYGLTYRLKDGKKMEIQDVLSGSDYKIKKKIASTYAKKIASAGYEPIMRKDCSDFQFYIKPGKKVVVCFGPYQPMGGNGRSSIKLKGKLK